MQLENPHLVDAILLNWESVMLRVTLLCILCLTDYASIRAESYPHYTLKGWVERSGAVVIAKRVKPLKKAPKSGQLVTCEIVTVIKADQSSVKRGGKISFTYRQYAGWKPQMATGPLLLLKGNREKRGDKTSRISWWPQANASAGLAKYIMNAPAVDLPAAKRLPYFYRFLEHAEPTIAADAYKEFLGPSYKSRLAFGRTLKPVRLRKRIENPKTQPKRRGLYCMLLGMCGKPKDAEMLKLRISRVSKNFELGHDGLMFGYLMLTGEEGLKFLDETKLARKMMLDDKGRPIFDKQGLAIFNENHSVMMAIRLMWNYAPERIGRKRLLKSMRILLDNPEMNDLVIPDLGRWKDWSVQDRLIKAYGTRNFQGRSIRYTIIRYLLASTKDIPKGQKDNPPPRVLKARKFLAMLRKKDPETVRRAERSFF